MSVAEFQVDPCPLEMLQRSPTIQGDTGVVRQPTPHLASESSKQRVESPSLESCKVLSDIKYIPSSNLSKQDVEPKELRPHGLDPSVITDHVEYMMALKVGDASADHALEFFCQSEDPHPRGPNMYIVIPRAREHEVKELRPPDLSDKLISEVPDEEAVEAMRVSALDREIAVNDGNPKCPTQDCKPGVERGVDCMLGVEFGAEAREVSNSPHEPVMQVEMRRTIVPNPITRPVVLLDQWPRWYRDA
ncbi:uncharacterized protein EI90DRAFT_3068623 [Cantharellus anzutake]|uniref:uncharacterized protein n=1 Tax=Cantharellus anzutake TaxID=1750568 RepID=UPI00190374B7|nr:uncharacterized protein EI90DRAFT_3068623 [Cantharellus anzutake]KAF8327297.1 hypothetical protein EI90DRAFT_3068623 [Cantharellus anzutake]